MNEKLKNVKCFLLDMDGTVYLGNRLIDGAIDAVRRMNAVFARDVSHQQQLGGAVGL